MERAIPIKRAVIKVPVICPRPAVATTVNETTIVSAPIPGEREETGTASAPPSAPKIAPKTN